MNYSGSSERILKKCREVNKRDFFSYFTYNDSDDEEEDRDEIIEKNKNHTYEKNLKDILELNIID